MTKLDKKYVIGTHVMWFEIEMFQGYCDALINTLETVENPNNITIDICFNEKLNKNFIKNLTEKLLLWTGKRWIITLSKSKGEKTLFEKNKEKLNEEIAKFRDNKKFKEILEHFPDAKVDKIDGDNDA